MWLQGHLELLRFWLSARSLLNPNFVKPKRSENAFWYVCGSFHAVCSETARHSTSSMAKIGNYKEICKKKDGNFTWSYNKSLDIIVMNAVMLLISYLNLSHNLYPLIRINRTQMIIEMCIMANSSIKSVTRTFPLWIISQPKPLICIYGKVW